MHVGSPLVNQHKPSTRQPVTFIYSTSIPQAWPQPLDPLHSVVLSAGTATVPLIVVLLLTGWLRKIGLHKMQSRSV